MKTSFLIFFSFFSSNLGYRVSSFYSSNARGGEKNRGYRNEFGFNQWTVPIRLFLRSSLSTKCWKIYIIFCLFVLLFVLFVCFVVLIWGDNEICNIIEVALSGVTRASEMRRRSWTTRHWFSTPVLEDSFKGRPREPTKWSDSWAMIGSYFSLKIAHFNICCKYTVFTILTN